MDLNQLLYRHQVSLMRADAAACVASRHSHRGLAVLYAERIAEAHSGPLLLPARPAL